MRSISIPASPRRGCRNDADRRKLIGHREVIVALDDRLPQAAAVLAPMAVLILNALLLLLTSGAPLPLPP